MSNTDITPAAPAELDAHGFDPSEFEWVPIPRRRRSDGWDPRTQRRFIEALADTGSVTYAAREVNMSLTSCYRLRRSPGAEGFAAAWKAAIVEASNQLVDIGFDRAINGVEDPVLDKDGVRIFTRRRYNDRLLMFLIRAHHPERYGRPRGADEGEAQGAPADARPVAGAIEALAPVAPAEPHRLVAPEKLATYVDLYADPEPEPERIAGPAENPSEYPSESPPENPSLVQPL